MAERATKAVLLRLRRVRELELRRELAVTRASRAEAKRAAVGVEAARRKLERALADAQAKRAGALDRPRAAGRIATADRFERALRDQLLLARTDERRVTARLDAAERALAATQRALRDAVQARQRSESLAATEKAAAARALDRREQAEIEDRYRAPSRTSASRRRS